MGCWSALEPAKGLGWPLPTFSYRSGWGEWPWGSGRHRWWGGSRKASPQARGTFLVVRSAQKKAGWRAPSLGMGAARGRAQLIPGFGSCPDPQDRRLINGPGVVEPWSCEGFGQSFGAPWGGTSPLASPHYSGLQYSGKLRQWRLGKKTGHIRWSREGKEGGTELGRSRWKGQALRVQRS